MLVQEQLIVTATDRDRLRQMIDHIRRSLPVDGHPYGRYLRAVEDQIGRAAVIAAEEVDGDVVTMNSKVGVRDLGTGRYEQWTLVYEADADAFGERVSVLAPMGLAVLGARVGGVVEWNSRRGDRRLQVEHILFQPEAAGRYEL